MNPAQKTFELIHYGTDRFDFNRFPPIRNRGWIKPRGGLWTSPVDSKCGWKHWCEEQDFNPERLEKFTLFTFTGNTLTINDAADLDLLPWTEGEARRISAAILFEKLFEDGVEAIHLTERGQEETRWSSPYSLYGWDCETVLILNPAGLAVTGSSRTILQPQPHPA